MRIVPLVPLVLFVSLVPSISCAADLRNFDDAALHAVQFVDGKEGWVVGDEGVIWHTIDGGLTWERQPSGTRGSLRSLHFHDPYLGWVVGREELPGGKSAGVVLFTRDGGLKWNRLLANSLPGLNHVRFPDPKGDAKIGYLLGDCNDTFPSGIFKTSDAGKTWESVPGPRSTTWLTAAFQDKQTAFLGGAWSRLVTFRGGVFSGVDAEGLGSRSIRGLHLGDRRTLAVGQGGLILSSVSGGTKWGFAEFNLPPEVRASIDFHAVHAVGRKVCIVGRPGSVALTSNDHGETWVLTKTGQRAPLNAVYFADENTGWAVGELGSILQTRDGGKSWITQRKGGERTALLFVHARSKDVPLDVLSLLGADDGYLAAALQVVAPDPLIDIKRVLQRDRGEGRLDPTDLERHLARLISDDAVHPQRMSAAVRSAGGVTGEVLWQFPLPDHFRDADRKLILARWDEAHDNQAGKQLLGQLVLALRMWRPDVVVSDHPDPKAIGNAAGSLVAEALHEACALAGDPKSFPEQIEKLALEAWRPSKMYVLWDSRADAQVTLDNRAVRPRLDGTAADHAVQAGRVLQVGLPEVPLQRHFRLLKSNIEGAGSQILLMGGLNDVAVGKARRPLSEVPAIQPEAEAAIRARASLESLAGKLGDPSRTLGQIAPLLATLPDDQAAAAGFAIAHRFAQQGQWDVARETFLLMVDRYPAHPLAAEAYTWLMRHNSSSEARRRHELGQFVGMGTEIVQTSSRDKAKPNALAAMQELRHWYRGSLEIGKRLASFGPLYGGDPAMQFCMQASRRQINEQLPAQEWFAKFRTFYPKGVWQDAAGQELWQATRSGPPPRGSIICKLAPEKPFLDGKLDDPCWRDSTTTKLINGSDDTAKDFPTDVAFTFDKEFLYIALRCRHPAGHSQPAVKNRPRDADLRAFDRVSITLDLDRDYATYFHLQVDQRGCVREDCWGDAGWNPRWFVAAHAAEDAWHVEAAIPLSELTGDRVLPGAAWACNVVRILPGRGLQAVSLPAYVEPHPQSMGLLVFQDAGQNASPERGARTAEPKK